MELTCCYRSELSELSIISPDFLILLVEIKKIKHKTNFHTLTSDPDYLEPGPSDLRCLIEAFSLTPSCCPNSQDTQYYKIYYLMS